MRHDAEDDDLYRTGARGAQGLDGPLVNLFNGFGKEFPEHSGTMQGQGQDTRKRPKAHSCHEDQRQNDFVDAASDIEHLPHQMKDRNVGRYIACCQEAHRNGHDDGKQRPPDRDLNGLDGRLDQLGCKFQVGWEHPADEVGHPGCPLGQINKADLTAQRGPPEYGNSHGCDRSTLQSAQSPALGAEQQLEVSKGRHGLPCLWWG